MPAISPRLGEFLIKTTGAKDIDNAFHTIFFDYVVLKIKNLEETIAHFQKKWGMNFKKFKQQMNSSSSKNNNYSFDVEKDFWKWEEVETLKNHYETLRKEWI